LIRRRGASNRQREEAAGLRDGFERRAVPALPLGNAIVPGS